jgi:outer membrane lipoprotein LolB
LLRTFLRDLTVLASLLIFSACSTMSPQATKILPKEDGSHLSKISQIEHFKARGKIGIQSHGYGVTGTLEWTHENQSDSINVSSPLGNRIFQIVSNEEGVILTDQNGLSTQAKNAESLTQKQYGWSIPFQSVAFWMLGNASNKPITDFSIDEQGKITKLVQEGWETDYLNYQPISSYFLPQKLNLHSDKLAIKIVIDSWNID